MPAKQQHEKRDIAQDRAVEDSFPASDPPANSGITGGEVSDHHERDIDAEPTGTPTSDRHGTETAHHREHESKSPT